jgi:hypothetical protein
VFSVLTDTPAEVSISQDLLERILASATHDAVLVGGQSLAFWVARYDIKLPEQFLVGAISDDADFLGNRNDVKSIAAQTNGVPEYPPKRAITALVGQVRIPLSPTAYVNVDVLHSLIGLSAADVRKRASLVTIGHTTFSVMHPMDVFLSRIENLATLKEKQTPPGIEQAKLGVLVARHFIEETANSQEMGQKEAGKLIEYVVKVAKTGAGRRVSRDYGVDFRAGIPGYVINSESFQKIRYPQILGEINPR